MEEWEISDLNLWSLCDDLSIVHAALLIVSEDPAQNGNVEGWEIHQRPRGYEAARTALVNAVLSGKLKANIRRKAWVSGWNEEPGLAERYAGDVFIFPDQKIPSEDSEFIAGRGVIYRAEPDWALTTINIDDLKAWLLSRGYKRGFFFEENGDAPDYLDQNNECYAPKLAAAIAAWEAVSRNPELVKGKTPKAALEVWLRRNADKFGLTKEDGNPNETGIEEVAKIANWSLKGGAPKTPG